MKIKVQPHTIEIEKETDINAGEYNISSCEFEFSEEYENLTKEAVFSTCDSTYKVAILSGVCTIPEEALTSQGQVLLGVYAYELTGDVGHEELVLRYSPTPKYFSVSRGSYREGNDPDLPVPSEWERVLALINEAIEETNNLNITVDKENKVTHVVLTKKDGTTEEVDIEDGKSLEFNWQGTSLGVRVEGQTEYQYVNLKGDKGDAGAIKMQIVAELPETGQDDTIYLVPLEHPDIQGNNYAEYVWVNNQWELLGKVGVQVDLTDYVKFTDYATGSTGGVIKTNSQYGTGMDSGYLRGASCTYQAYQERTGDMFITKTTLNNVINGKGLIEKNVNDLSNYTTTTDMNALLGNKLDTSKVVNATSTTAGETYDVRYINGLIGDINSALDTINGEVI